MKFEKAFDSIKQKFNDAEVNNISDFALQVTLSDEDCGGTFYVAVQEGVLDVSPYDYKDNNAVLDITKSDFVALITGKKSLQKVVENGATLKGDATTVDSIKAMLKKAAPAKKTAAKATKKTTTKAAAEKTTAAKTTAAKTTAEKTTAVKTTAAKTTAAKTTAKAAPAKKAVKAADKKSK